MNTCCNNIYPDEDLRRWENCNSTALANPENYYTKDEVDDIIEQIEISGGSIEYSAGTGIDITDHVISCTVTGGSGISSGDVESMIADAVSTKADTSAVTAVSDALTAHTSNTHIHVSSQDKYNWNNKLSADALNGYWTSGETSSAINAATSGKADTSAVTAINDALTAHTSNTHIHVTSQDKQNWGSKQNALIAGTGIEITSGNVINCTVTGGTGSGMTSGEVQTMIDSSISGINDTLSSHTANTTVHVTQANKNLWDTVGNKADEDKFWCGSSSDYNIETDYGQYPDPNKIYFIYEDLP